MPFVVVIRRVLEPMDFVFEDRRLLRSFPLGGGLPAHGVVYEALW